CICSSLPLLFSIFITVIMPHLLFILSLKYHLPFLAPPPPHTYTHTHTHTYPDTHTFTPSARVMSLSHFTHLYTYEHIHINQHTDVLYQTCLCIYSRHQNLHTQTYTHTLMNS